MTFMMFNWTFDRRNTKQADRDKLQFKLDTLKEFGAREVVSNRLWTLKPLRYVRFTG